MLLDSLKFVQGAVAKKELNPVLTHFSISNGTIMGFNGVLALQSPIALDISCIPNAITLTKAVSACTDSVAINLTKSGRLSVRSGKFRAYIECYADDEPFNIYPEGPYIPINAETGIMFKKALDIIYPFIGKDLSKPWSTGALFKDQSIFATNNTVIIQYWLGINLPVICNIPKITIQHLMKIKDIPVAFQMTDQTITVHYEGGRWLRSSLLSPQWPDLTRAFKSTASNAINPELFEALAAIKPFLPKSKMVFIKNNSVSTAPVEDQGISFEVDTGLNWEGIYNFDALMLLKNADLYDMSYYPNPCPFKGERLRGAIVGATL